MKRVKILVGIVLFVILMVFAVSNKEEVRVNYWGDHSLPLAGYRPVDASGVGGSAAGDTAPVARPVPLFVVIFGCFGLGFAVSWFFGLGPQFRMRSQLRRCRRTIRQLEKELAELQALPAGPAGAAGGTPIAPEPAPPRPPEPAPPPAR